MKHKKTIAALAAAGTFVAMSGAAHAISPAAALGLAAIGGAAVGSAAAHSQHDAALAAAHANTNHTVTVVPAVPAAPSTVVMGAAPATVTTVQDVSGDMWVPGQVTNFDHDGDGVLNHSDRFPNDQSRS